MNHMTMEYERIRAKAWKLAGVAKSKGQQIDGDDLTQLTFERFYEKGMDLRVDPTKGSALMLLYRVLAFIYLEALRSEAKNHRLKYLPTRIPSAPDTVSQVIKNERMEFARNAMAGIAPGFKSLTKRERSALTKVYGSLFNQHAENQADSNDYAAAYRAKIKLRDAARRIGLMDE